MANPVKAFRDTPCYQCDETIDKDDDLFLMDGEKYCYECAEENGNVCECGQFKKEDFKECYDCSRN